VTQHDKAEAEACDPAQHDEHDKEEVDGVCGPAEQSRMVLFPFFSYFNYLYLISSTHNLYIVNKALYFELTKLIKQ